MKRLFFYLTALTIGAFTFMSCDDENAIDNGDKGADGEKFMTVQEQQTAISNALTGVAESIEFTELSSAAEVVAQAVGKEWSFMSLMPIFEDTVLVRDSIFLTKMAYAMQLATGSYESFEDMNIDLQPLYMVADVEIFDTVLDRSGDTIAAVSIKNVRYDVDYLLLNISFEGHAIIFKARIEQGDSELEYENVERNINATLALPELIEMTLTLDGKVLADVKGEFKSDYKVVVTSDEEKSVEIDGSKTWAKGYIKVAGYELNGELNFENTTGATVDLAAKYGTTELLSMKYNMDATMEGVDMTDSAQVLAWAMNPEKLKKMSLQASLYSGKVQLKANLDNPFGNKDLANNLMTLINGGTLSKEKSQEMVDQINEVFTAGLYFEGYKDPQAKFKIVYADTDKRPSSKGGDFDDDDDDSGIMDEIEGLIEMAGAYVVMVVRDDDGKEKEMPVMEYFGKIDVDGIIDILKDKVEKAFGIVIEEADFKRG
ncbi:MAG: hypothetical protein MJY68_01185 [Bacteroidaceae bacterium]|nr:hypothetical protein [Bacteroidaceae bacterium]